MEKSPIPVLHRPDRTISTPFGNIVVPPRRRSQQTYEFLGFTPEAAAKRWNIEEQLTIDPVTDDQLLETVLKYLPDRIGLDFHEYFAQYHIGDELREAIMDPMFTDIRGTAPVSYWIRDSICGGITVLEHYCRSERLHDQPTAGKCGDTKESGVTLYKGVGSWRIAHLFDVTTTSRVTLSSLVASEPARGDFSHGNNGLYFTPQREIAQRFAEYATRCTYGVGSSRIVKIHVPDDFLQIFQHRHIYVHDEKEIWKKTVIHCRFGFLYKRKQPQPLKLMQILRDNDYLVGHVSTGHVGAPIRQLCRNLDDSNILYVQGPDGQRIQAEQWMFKGDILDSLEKALGRNGTSSITVEMPVRNHDRLEQADCQRNGSRVASDEDIK